MDKLLSVFITQLAVAQKELVHEVYFDTDKFDVKIAGQSKIQLDNYFDKKPFFDILGGWCSKGKVLGTTLTGVVNFRGIPKDVS